MSNSIGNIAQIAWNFRQLDNQTTKIFIYDVIADKQSTNWWTGEKGTEITPTLFSEELSKITTPNICVHISSGGGNVFAAEAIRTAIREKRQEGKKITCKIDGLCASAAVGIAAACETIAIPSSAYFMIHDPALFAYGYYSIGDLRKEITMLEKIKQGIINAYSAKTGKDKQEISALMSLETWYTGDEAVANGFCDEVMFEENESENTQDHVNASVFNFAMYRNCPTALLNSHVAEASSSAQAERPARTPAAAVEHIQNQNQDKKGAKEQMEIKTVEDLRVAYPELVAQLETTATAAERKRIQDIENIALPGFEGVINKAKFENPENAAVVAMNIIAEQKKQGAAHLADVDTDVKNSGISGVTASGHEGADGEINPYFAAIDSEMPKTK